jgi:hypothetical protein
MNSTAAAARRIPPSRQRLPGRGVGGSRFELFRMAIQPLNVVEDCAWKARMFASPHCEVDAKRVQA